LFGQVSVSDVSLRIGKPGGERNGSLFLKNEKEGTAFIAAGYPIYWPFSSDQKSFFEECIGFSEKLLPATVMLVVLVSPGAMSPYC
jgi:hypothetical protein